MLTSAARPGGVGTRHRRPDPLHAMHKHTGHRILMQACNPAWYNQAWVEWQALAGSGPRFQGIGDDVQGVRGRVAGQEAGLTAACQDRHQIALAVELDSPAALVDQPVVRSPLCRLRHKPYRINRLGMSVGPPSSQATTWWRSVHSGGRSHPAPRQPLSLTTRALRCPRSRPSSPGPRSAAPIRADQHPRHRANRTLSGGRSQWAPAAPIPDPRPDSRVRLGQCSGWRSGPGAAAARRPRATRPQHPRRQVYQRVGPPLGRRSLVA
jgi:hypothetical protein